MALTALKNHTDGDQLFDDQEAYEHYCLKLIEEKAAGLTSIDDIAAKEADLNVYPHIDCLEKPRNVYLVDDNALSDTDRQRAAACILEGRLFSEHAAAGEATRLGLGSKYLLNIHQDLSEAQIATLISQETSTPVTPSDVRDIARHSPRDIEPLSLGARHMLQFSFDIHNLAMSLGKNPEQALLRQKMLIILNQQSAAAILSEIQRFKYFGFSWKNVYFMIQQSFYGINLKHGQFFFDPSSPTRLHNHGQIVIQQTMRNQIFTLDPLGEHHIVNKDEFHGTLATMEDKVAYNIENLDFLTGSIDYAALAFALKQGDKGTQMIMEIVGNDPVYPQKGGMAAYDPILKKNVMIEGFQLKGLENKDIYYLNKNFNHYPHPAESWLTVKQHGLNMPITVKEGYLYFQPVQGDINFLVKTDFFSRKQKTAISSLKSPYNLPAAILKMAEQDKHPGFIDYAREMQAY